MNKSLDLFENQPFKKYASKATRSLKPKTRGKTKKLNSSIKPGLVDDASYTANDIEVLEGLEPVRHRPGMYIGGIDSVALHHLLAEVIDNSMDEAIAGHASWIEVILNNDLSISVRDNGRGIPIEKHPKFKDLSALEVILTKLHSGGKFSGKVYATSGGLHGVGLSVVNALSEHLIVEVARDGKLWRQTYCRGKPTEDLKFVTNTKNRRGTLINFRPDSKIFGVDNLFVPKNIFRLLKGKAYLFKGVEIRWSCPPELLVDQDTIPEKTIFHFPNGLSDHLAAELGKSLTITRESFSGEVKFQDGSGRVEWAIAWPENRDAFMASHCNTVPTLNGGTHDQGLRLALLRGLKSYGELTGVRRAQQLISEDVSGTACIVLSVFLREPQFQGQTKDKLTNPEASRLVESVLRDHFDHWLSANPSASNLLLSYVLEHAEERLQRKKEKDVKRKTATRKVRLPGKLTDCSSKASAGTEIFIVEGDSAGGSAKQARDRKTQAILPLKGKILNVANASNDKIRANQELNDLIQALGCNTRSKYNEEGLRYERVIIMTDADVDGAHIASLLMTYFYREMPDLITNGHLFLAQPPLYRLTQVGKTLYARDDKHRESLLETVFSKKGKVEISRFKGLGEMPAQQLRETTMDPKNRRLLQIRIPSGEELVTARRVEELMGRKPESRLSFIQKSAKFASNLDI